MPEATIPDTTTSPGVRAFDQNGNEVLVPREKWASEVLPNMVRNAWDTPEQLYFVIVNSLNEGFVAEIAPAAQRLYETDPVPVRGTCVWGATLIALDRLVEAEMVLSTWLERNGEDNPQAGSVLVHLAKVYQAKGEASRAETTLHRALAVDPNEDNALGWLAGITAQREGESAVPAAIQRIAAHPLSWRPQIWLARQALTAQQVEEARALYIQALANAPHPAPPELLIQMSGDLGNHALLEELLALTSPQFVPELHGLAVGNNLIKANVDLGRLEDAEALVNSLTPFNQPEWAQPLLFWQAEIAKRRGTPLPEAAQQNGSPAAPQHTQQQIQIGMIRIDGPVWLPTGSPAHSLFAPKSPAAPTVTFLGGSAESPESDPGPQLTDLLGRMTRALPLFLSEQTQMRTAAAASTLLPWALAAPAGGAESPRPAGFVVSSQRWPDETAVQAAVQSVPDPSARSEYVVTVHLDAEVTPWEASLVFLRTSDGAQIGELSAEFAPESPDDPLLTLAGEMVDLLGVLGAPAPSAAYAVPPKLTSYLLHLEHLLAIRCASMEGATALPVEAEREALDSLFELVSAYPASQPLRLLLRETLAGLERPHPTLTAEFRDRFAALPTLAGGL